MSAPALRASTAERAVTLSDASTAAVRLERAVNLTVLLNTATDKISR